MFLTKLDALANWVRKNSLWPMPFATACCGIELMATGAIAARHRPLRRRGDAVQPAAVRPDDRRRPRGHEDAAGAAAHLAADARAEMVHLDGRCASTGGVFDTYAVVQGIDRFIPVDMYVPGCPPRPEQLMAAIIDLQEKIQQTGTFTGHEFAQRTIASGPSPFDRDELVPSVRPTIGSISSIRPRISADRLHRSA